MSDIDKEVWFPMWKKWRDENDKELCCGTMGDTALNTFGAYQAFEAAFKAGAQHQAAQSDTKFADQVNMKGVNRMLKIEQEKLGDALREERAQSERLAEALDGAS